MPDEKDPKKITEPDQQNQQNSSQNDPSKKVKPDLDKLMLLLGNQLSIIGNLKKEKNELEHQLAACKKELEKYNLGVENLEQEFTQCKEEIKYSDVGGLDPVIERIKKFNFAIAHPEIYDHFATNPPRSLLLYGPPGTGKTMIGKAISHELNSYFLVVSRTRFISKWVGEAEKTLEAILVKSTEIAERDNKKVVIFIDEAENVFRKRGQYGDAGVSDNCVNVLLSYMDGFQKNDRLIFVAATNMIDLVDDAAKRAGRFDFIIEIPYPDLNGVEDILRKQVAYKERKANREFYQINDYGKLAEMIYRGNQFYLESKVSGADIQEILRLTSERKIKEMEQLFLEFGCFPDDVKIKQYEIEETIRNYDPTGRKKKEKKPMGF